MHQKVDPHCKYWRSRICLLVTYVKVIGAGELHWSLKLPQDLFLWGLQSPKMREPIKNTKLGKSEKIHGGPLTFVVIQWRHNALNQWVFLIETLVKWRHTAFEHHPNMSHSNSPKKSHSQHFRGQKYLFCCLKTALDELQSLHKWTQRSRQMRPFLFTFKHCASWMFLLFCTSSLSWDTLKELWQQKLVVPHGKIVTLRPGNPMFENHRKSLIQHREWSELRLHYEWTKNNLKCQKWLIWRVFEKLAVKQCYQTGQF